MSRLQGKKAIITGGTSGIGRSTVMHFVEEGAQVLFTGRDQQRAQQTIDMASELDADADIHFIEHDITSDKGWQAVYAKAKALFGDVDIAINCAGVFGYSPIEDTSVEDFKKMWVVNVDACFLGTKHAMISMQDNPNGGNIVNVASLSGLMGHPSCVSYCSSKAGAIMLSRVAALEGGPKVRVNAVAPGPVWNELLERAHTNDDTEAMKEYYRTDQPLKVLGDSSDVAKAIVYLASDEARNVTGAVMRIDAGRGSD